MPTKPRARLAILTLTIFLTTISTHHLQALTATTVPATAPTTVPAPEPPARKYTLEFRDKDTGALNLSFTGDEPEVPFNPRKTTELTPIRNAVATYHLPNDRTLKITSDICKTSLAPTPGQPSIPLSNSTFHGNIQITITSTAPGTTQPPLHIYLDGPLHIRNSTLTTSALFHLDTPTSTPAGKGLHLTLHPKTQAPTNFHLDLGNPLPIRKSLLLPG
jgi:hypothetical protein